MIFHGQLTIFLRILQIFLPSRRWRRRSRWRRGWNPGAISQIKRNGGNKQRQNQCPKRRGFVALAVRGLLFACNHWNDQIVFFYNFVENNRQQMQTNKNHQHPRHLLVNGSDKKACVFINQVIKRTF